GGRGLPPPAGQRRAQHQGGVEAGGHGQRRGHHGEAEDGGAEGHPGIVPHPHPGAAGAPGGGEDSGVTRTPPITPPTDAWGIDATWTDAAEEEHRVSPETIARLREVIGTPPD